MSPLRQIELYEEDNRHWAAYFLINYERYAGTLELRWAVLVMERFAEETARARKEVPQDVLPDPIPLPEPRDADIPPRVQRRPIQRVRYENPAQQKLFA